LGFELGQLPIDVSSDLLSLLRQANYKRAAILCAGIPGNEAASG
jgi:hypothetical protein